jgi:DnaJ-class molecular chaperone
MKKKISEIKDKPFTCESTCSPLGRCGYEGKELCPVIECRFHKSKKLQESIPNDERCTMCAGLGYQMGYNNQVTPPILPHPSICGWCKGEGRRRKK